MLFYIFRGTLVYRQENGNYTYKGHFTRLIETNKKLYCEECQPHFAQTPLHQQVYNYTHQISAGLT